MSEQQGPPVADGDVGLAFEGEEPLARLLMRGDRAVAPVDEDAAWQGLGPFSRTHYRLVARAVLAHLAPRLITGAVEERVEHLGRQPCIDGPMTMHQRTVRTWRAPDGTVTTQVGPWREVD